MGGIADCGVGFDTETSPRRVAIEKAQAELQKECYVREKRRKELEFLEKGGNPLDFKFGNSTSISVESTSITAQLAEHQVISEGKGSFARSASAHCDSVESSGRPEVSLCRDTNTADNLLLLNARNGKDQDGDKIIKRAAKRGNMMALDERSPLDNSNNATDLDDAKMFRRGAKKQAYARTYKSRSARDCSQAASSDQIQDSRCTVLPSLVSDSKGTKTLPGNEDCIVSSFSISKPASPSGDKFDTVVDGIQTHERSKLTKTGVVDCVSEAFPTQSLQVNHEQNQHTSVAVEQIRNDNALASCDLGATPRDVSNYPVVALVQDLDASSTGERVDVIKEPDKVYFLIDDLPIKNRISDPKTEILDNINSDKTLSTFSTNKNIDANNDIVDVPLPAEKLSGASDGDNQEHSVLESSCSMQVTHSLEENKDVIAVEQHATASNLTNSVNTLVEKKEDTGLCASQNDTKNDDRVVSDSDAMCLIDGSSAKSDSVLPILPCSDFNVPKDPIILPTITSSSHELLNVIPATGDASNNSGVENGTTNHMKLAKKLNEDAILNEARIIEATLKRAGDLPMPFFSAKQKKCHWDFVLEEMAWLANDFMQERLWKISAAAQMCHLAASARRSMFALEKACRSHGHIARTLSRAVMNFWCLAKASQSYSDASVGLNEDNASGLLLSQKISEPEVAQCQGTKSEERKQAFRPIHDYAVRFLKYNANYSVNTVPVEAPATPNRINDAGVMELPFEDQLSEENLFYTVPVGAMQAYRESVESMWLPYKDKNNNSMQQEDHEASVCDSAADGPREYMYEEDGVTGGYFLPVAYEGGLPSKFNQKKQKGIQQHATRFYEVGPDLSYDPVLENKFGNRALKRPSGVLNVGLVPPKRVRTATRQRVTSPFDSGGHQMISRTDFSSGDTNSFQDDQSSLHGGSHPRKILDIESTMDSMRRLPYDAHELSIKTKKKKKPKHLGYKSSINLTDPGVFVPRKGFSYDQRMQVDSIALHEQGKRKRLESHQFESNGNAGFYGKHVAKKPKLMKQLPEISPDTTMPIIGSMSSPVASQMSNMSNSNKLMRIITSNRDRVKKSKSMKGPAGHTGSGNPWSAFEDQALVVLVHDMGPNWELISDAINSAVQFKYIFRKPRECKERHKFLMDKSAGEGADSAEDSGSSQPYPSTLPGIPKGSARQLFQRLQGPMLEDTLKLHFGIIIKIVQQLHFCRSQEPKQISPSHPSHAVAVSQVCPNDSSGSFLTPLDHCDATSSSSDAHALAISNHPVPALVPPALPTSSGNSILQGSPGLALSGGLPSPSAPLSMTSRDAHRYSVPRQAPQADEQQRSQQYNQIIPGRSIQQAGISVQGGVSSGIDRAGVRMLSGGNSMGMMCGINRGMPMHRPGIQGVNSPGMLNMHAPAVGVPNAVNMHAPAVSCPGSSILRPREALNMLRPSQNTEDQRQMIIQELQNQASQGNGPAATAFSGTSAPFSNVALPSPVQPFPVNQHQQPHQMPQVPHVLNNPHHGHITGASHSSQQHPAYAIRFAKDRQLQQQRAMPQSQIPFSGPDAMPPSQISPQKQQTQLPSPSITVPSQAQPCQQQILRAPQPGPGMPNQMMKQRQRPMGQQQARNNQQQRQHGEQPAKQTKSLSKGAISMHQSIPRDVSPGNGLSPAPPKNQNFDKHLMQQIHGFPSGGSVANPSMPQPPGHQKMHSRPLPKSTSPMPSHSESCNHGPSHQVAPGHAMLNPEQNLAQPPMPSSSQLQQHQSNHSQQAIHRLVLQQNCQAPATDQVQGNQATTPTSSAPQCVGDSIGSASSASPMAVHQRKPEASYDARTPTSNVHLGGSPQEKFPGNEAVLPSSSQGSVQRQFSGKWQQDHHQQPLQTQQLHQQTIGGNLHARPSNSGQG